MYHDILREWLVADLFVFLGLFFITLWVKESPWQKRERDCLVLEEQPQLQL